MILPTKNNDSQHSRFVSGSLSGVLGPLSEQTQDARRARVPKEPERSSVREQSHRKTDSFKITNTQQVSYDMFYTFFNAIL